jgi:hypothetical protein
MEPAFKPLSPCKRMYIGPLGQLSGRCTCVYWPQFCAPNCQIAAIGGLKPAPFLPGRTWDPNSPTLPWTGLYTGPPHPLGPPVCPVYMVGQHATPLPRQSWHYPLVLGIAWLRHYDVSIRFSTNTITFDSPACMGHRQEPVIVKGIEDVELLISSHKELPAPVPSAPPTPSPASKPSISIISEASFGRLARNKGQRYGRVRIFSLSLYEINKALDRKTIESGDLASMVPAEFHEFHPLFDKIVADRLPPHRQYDHKIVLKDGFEPPFGPLYSLSRPELEALKAFLEENLDKHFIRQSSSSAGAPILFTKKGD